MFQKTLLVLTLILLGLISTADAVMLNEILYDNQGNDDPNVLFTELWGTPGTDIGGWTLVGINGNGGTEYVTITIPDGTTIPSDGYFVIGNTSSVPNVDYVCGGGMGAGVDFQNAGSTTGADCDGIDLRDADGATVDHVCYGVCAAGHLCSGEGGANAPDPFPSGGVNRAIARIPDHQDTDHNGTDWVVTETLTPGAPNTGVPCDPQYVVLSDIRANDADGVPTLDSTFVVVRGIVNVDNFTFDSTGNTRFFFQDDDAGCNVFRISPPGAVMAGDCVVVSGFVSKYRGLTELVASGTGSCVAAIEVRTHVNPPAPSLITGASSFEQYEGMLVRMNNVSIVSGTWPAEGSYGDLVITDGNGTIGLSINKWTNVDGSPEPSQPFSIIGVMGQYDVSAPYNDYYQITPRTTDDIITLAAGDPGSVTLAGEFKLAGTYPNPFNSTAQIQFEVGSARELSLNIYDILGREVLSQKLTGLTPGAHTYAWTPSGAAGLYLVRMKGTSLVQTAKLLYLK